MLQAIWMRDPIKELDILELQELNETLKTKIKKFKLEARCDHKRNIMLHSLIVPLDVPCVTRKNPLLDFDDRSTRSR